MQIGAKETHLVLISVKSGFSRNWSYKKGLFVKIDSALRKNLDEAIYDQRATDDQNLSVGQQKKKICAVNQN